MVNFNFDCAGKTSVQLVFSSDEIEQILEDYIYAQYGFSTSGPLECFDGDTECFISEIRVMCTHPTGDNER